MILTDSTFVFSRYFEELSAHWTELEYRVLVMFDTLDSEGTKRAPHSQHFMLW